ASPKLTHQRCGLNTRHWRRKSVSFGSCDLRSAASSRSKCRRRLAGHVASKRCFRSPCHEVPAKKRNPRNRFLAFHRNDAVTVALTVDRSARPRRTQERSLEPRAAQSPARPSSISLELEIRPPRAADPCPLLV